MSTDHQPDEVFVQNVYAFEREIARLNKKASRIGVAPIVATNLGQITKSRLVLTSDEDGNTSERRMPVDVTRFRLEIPDVKLRGWTALAKLTPVEGNGVFVDPLVPGFDSDAWKQTDINRCDHCNVRRNRVISYVVQNSEGSTMQVGRKCFEDIVGKDTLSALEFRSVVIWSLSGDDEGFYPRAHAGAVRVVALRDCVAAAEAMFAVDGWQNNVKNRYSGDIDIEGTHRYAGHVVADRPIRGRCDFSAEAKEQARATKIDLGHPAFDVADAVIERMRGLDVASDDEFAMALKNICEYSDIPAPKASLAAYMGQYLRQIDRKAKEAAKRATQQFVGIVGKRETFNLTCARCHSFESEYGTTYINVFEDENGNVVVWKTGSHCYSEGEKVTLKGTVKEHSVFREAKQTIITRCKEID